MTAVERSRRPLWVDLTLLVLAVAVFVTLVGLGNWQMRRLDWKLALIEAVESRAHGEAVAPPVADVSPDDYAYLRVRVDGSFRHGLARQIKAVTELGPGRWLMVPLRTRAGHVWINRGFTPAGSDPEAWSAPEGMLQIEGLLRVTEPDGTLLEKNAPLAGRWVSRDIAALSADAGLSDAAPYFIDADHAGVPDAWPRGGLTRINFRNPHLYYALTWYGMAVLFLAGMIYVIYDRWHSRHGSVERDG